MRDPEEPNSPFTGAFEPGKFRNEMLQFIMNGNGPSTPTPQNLSAQNHSPEALGGPDDKALSGISPPPQSATTSENGIEPHFAARQRRLGNGVDIMSSFPPIQPMRSRRSLSFGDAPRVAKPKQAEEPELDPKQDVERPITSHKRNLPAGDVPISGALELSTEQGTSSTLGNGRNAQELEGQLDHRGRFSMDKQYATETGAFAVLVDLNDTLVPGFDTGTVCRLGLGTYPGLYVTANIAMGPYTEPHLRLRFMVRHVHSLELFLMVTVPFNRLAQVPHVSEESTTDHEAFAALYTHEAPIFEELQGSPDMVDQFSEMLLQPRDGVDEQDQAADFISRITERVYTIRVEFARDDIFALDSVNFHQSWNTQPLEARVIATQVRSILEQCTLASMTLWFLPSDNFRDKWWDQIQYVDQFASPYFHLVRDTRDSIDDLTYGNIQTDDIYRPKKPVPATPIFHNKDHRTVALIMGVKEEQEMLEELATDLWDLKLPATVIDDPFSKWRPKPDDMQVYGIKADGQATHQYVVIDADDIGNLLPDIGDKCSIYFKHEVKPRSVPKPTLTSGQTRKAVTDLQTSFNYAEAKSDDALKALQEDIEMARRKAQVKKIEKLEQELPSRRDRVYLTQASRIIYPLLREPLPEVQRELQQEPSAVQLIASADRLAATLRRQKDEDETQWFKRLELWLKANGPARQPGPVTGLGDSWPAVRLQLPLQTRANVALFSVWTPSQHAWTPGMKHPPIDCKLPAVKVVGPVGRFLQSLKKPTDASHRHETVTIKIYHEPRDTTAKAECAAITSLNETSFEKAAAKFWAYSQAFDSKEPTICNLLERFPQLQKALDQGQFDKDGRDALESFKSVPCGVVFGGGPPGSGKSSFLVAVVKLVTSAPLAVPTAPKDAPKPEDDAEEDVLDYLGPLGIEALFEQDPNPWAGYDYALLQEDVETRRHLRLQAVEKRKARNERRKAMGGDEHPLPTRSGPGQGTSKKVLGRKRARQQAKGKNTEAHSLQGQTTSITIGEPLIDEIAAGPAFQNSEDSWNTTNWSNETDTKNLPAENAWNTAPQADWGAESQTQDWSSSTEAFSMPASKDQPAESSRAAPTGWDAEPSQIPTVAKGNAKVAWLAAQRKVVDDAVQRLRSACPDKIICRMLPWAVEMANVMEASPIEPTLIDTRASKLASGGDMTLAKHLNMSILKRHKESSPAHCLGSMSEYAKRVAQGSPDWDEYNQAMELQRRDPAAYKRDRTKYLAIGRDLLIHAANSCDVICATPVAIDQMANHVTWRPDLVILDEAARMTEALSSIPMAKYPEAAFILIGDTKQFPPRSLARDNPKYSDIFGPQRSTSLFARAEKLGVLTFTLYRNYRAHWNVADWAAKYFYPGRMTIVNRAPSLMVKEMKDWIQRVTRRKEVHSSTVLIEIPESTEVRIGTSYINPINASFISEFIVYLFRNAPVRNTVDFVKIANGETLRQRRGSILVIVPYSAQKNELQARISSLSPAEVPLELIDVRTIDDSPSHEADVVIADLTRTTSFKFVSEAERLAVMMTRPRLAMFIVGHPDIRKARGSLRDLVNWLDTRGATMSLGKHKKRPGWGLYCYRCCQHGHRQENCYTELKCLVCDAAGRDSEHAVRNCQFSREVGPSIYYDEPFNTDDGVPRDPLKSSNDSQGKRIKRPKDYRRPPPESKAAMSAEERDARRVLRQLEARNNADHDEDDEDEGDDEEITTMYA